MNAIYLRSLAALFGASVLLTATNSRRIVFEDITAASGIGFAAENGASPEKRMIETMGSGVGVLDYDKRR
jgi:hypothetical protein